MTGRRALFQKKRKVLRIPRKNKGYWPGCEREVIKRKMSQGLCVTEDLGSLWLSYFSQNPYTEYYDENGNEDSSHPFCHDFQSDNNIGCIHR